MWIDFKQIKTSVAIEQILASYEPPPLDPATDEALLDFIARRKAVLPEGVT